MNIFLRGSIKMKIIIEHYEWKFTAECDHEDVNLDDIIHVIKGLIIAIGFHPDALAEIFQAKNK